MLYNIFGNPDAYAHFQGCLFSLDTSSGGRQNKIILIIKQLIFQPIQFEVSLAVLDTGERTPPTYLQGIIIHEKIDPPDPRNMHEINLVWPHHTKCLLWSARSTQFLVPQRMHVLQVTKSWKRLRLQFH